MSRIGGCRIGTTRTVPVIEPSHEPTGISRKGAWVIALIVAAVIVIVVLSLAFGGGGGGSGGDGGY